MGSSLPVPLKVSRTKHILEGVFDSRSDPGRTLVPRIILSSNILCPCKGGVMRDRCDHPRALLESLDRKELIQFILDSLQIPEPISADVPSA